jgi:hypothetical protein
MGANLVKITDKLRHHPEATHQMVGDEAVIINLSTGDYYSLNDTGTIFWDLLDGERTVADCARAIAAEYDVEIEMVEADLLELAAEFEREGLIIV